LAVSRQSTCQPIPVVYERRVDLKAIWTGASGTRLERNLSTANTQANTPIFDREYEIIITRVEASGAKGRWFESTRAYHFFTTCNFLFFVRLTIDAAATRVGAIRRPGAF
jgi:hypothetical protein